MAFDATLENAITSNLTTWKGDALDMFGQVLPIALGLVIAVGVTFAVIRYFRGMVKM